MRLKSGCRGLWLVLPLVALDRLTKQLMMARYAPNGNKSVIPNVLSWAYTQNRGAAFSILSGRSALLIGLSVALIAALTVYLLRRPNVCMGVRYGLWMIVAGGLGNLFDRIAYGYVIDFIRLDFVRFAVFNPADSFICIGAFIAALCMLLCERKGTKKHA